MNSELVKKALDRVGNPNILVNLVSRRVRQLNAGGGGLGRPLLDDVSTLGVADTVLSEIIHEKIEAEIIVEAVAPEPPPRRRRRSSSSS